MAQISKALRFEILTRDGYRCRYCGAGAPTVQLQIDHVLPRSLGGRDDASNLVAACFDCNAGKSDRKIIALPPGFALTPDKRPARLEKLRRAKAKAQEAVPQEHVLDCSRIEEFDEENDGSQLCWVWCRTHGKLEWHSLPYDYVRQQDGLWRTSKKEVSW